MILTKGVLKKASGKDFNFGMVKISMMKETSQRF
jgi:hypothetical protein